jgi:hypothetical protein
MLSCGICFLSVVSVRFAVRPLFRIAEGLLLRVIRVPPRLTCFLSLPLSNMQPGTTGSPVCHLRVEERPFRAREHL